MGSTPLVTAPRVPPTVLYRDDALIVVDKPSGLAVHRGHSSEHGDYLLTRVRDAVGFHVYLAHRLDRGTSGVVVLTTAPEFVEPIQRAFAEGAVDKRYIAVVRGVVEGERLVDYAIPKNDSKGAERVPAQTLVRGLGHVEGRFSLIEAQPLSGRYHQIRRHMKHLQHPVVGDTTYGDGKVNRTVRERFGLMRMCLHAAALSVPHPQTGELLRFFAPIPEAIDATLAALGLPRVLSFPHLGASDERRSFDPE